MGKRKREFTDGTIAPNGIHKELDGDSKTKIVPKEPELPKKNVSSGPPTTIQIVIGTYEKILHGITAILPEKRGAVDFADTFLFSAHASAIRCLALSQPSSTTDNTQPAKIVLASGSSDQIINLYHLSTAPPSRTGNGLAIPSLTGQKITEDPRNRELGSLQHHNSSVNALQFPTRSKLLSAAEDNMIAVTRTRDWTVLSTIKVPIPKAHGRPSGDTAALGDTPAGVNDFAIHPSMKLMVSVGKGERCMRLWNLVTGKKAGVLNFERDLLQGIGEGKWASGEGRKVEWNTLGEEFVVGFERGAAVFGMDSKPKCKILPSPLTKIHQLRYLSLPAADGRTSDILAVSTEDGRIMFYSTTLTGEVEKDNNETQPAIPSAQPIGQIGGNLDGLKGRVKDFEILNLPAVGNTTDSLLIVAGSSDGMIRLWMLEPAQFMFANANLDESHTSDMNESSKVNSEANALKLPSLPQVGRLLGTYETGNRITCLKAFVMFEPNDLKDVTSKNNGPRPNDHDPGVDSNDSTSS